MIVFYYSILEVKGPSGPQLLVDGPSGWLDFGLRAHWALRLRLTQQTRLTYQLRLTHQMRYFWANGRTNKQGVSRRIGPQQQPHSEILSISYSFNENPDDPDDCL